MTTAALREVLDEEATAAIQAYIDAMASTYGVNAIEARVSLRRAVSKHARDNS